MIRWKQPEDPERGVSGNARQRRAVVRRWKALGLRVRHCGGAGQFLLDEPVPSLKTPNANLTGRRQREVDHD